MLPVTLACAVLVLVSAAAPAAGPVPPPVPPPGASGAVPAPAGSGWVPPVEPAVVRVSAFDPPDRRWLPGHRGVDLAAQEGQEVRAAGAGTVTFAGLLAGRGVVVVTHDGGLRTTYEPVDAVVAEGDQVRAGQLLGTLGDGDVHCGAPPRCLHWGLRRGQEYLDPWRLLQPGSPVLLPP